MNTVSNPTFSTLLSSKLSEFAEIIKNISPAEPKREIGYFQALKSIHSLVTSLFTKIADMAVKSGFKGVEKLEASPKGACENFVFAVIESEKITEVILAKNKKFGFLQNGGGKTASHESCEQAAYREAQEEFCFPGNQSQVKQITIESESGMPVFHFVKGVHIAFVTSEQANILKLSDDMANNTLARLPAEEFLSLTDNDKKPIDHGFDRKWIAEAIKQYNKTGAVEYFNERTITKDDYLLACKAKEWMQNIRVNASDIENLDLVFNSFIETELDFEAQADGIWKSPENRELIKKTAQKIVDTLVTRLLPAWSYQGKKGEETACQMKVQDAAPVVVNGDFLPSFLTISQMVALQAGSVDKREYKMIRISRESGAVNIITN